MRRAIMIGGIVLIGSMAQSLAGDPAANFAGSRETWSGDCRGADANLSGSGNTVTIHGGCRYFQIAGNDNRVLVEMAANGVIKVFGENNAVSWTGPGTVEVTKQGPGNVVARGH